MGHKRDPKHGKVLKCAEEDCKKEAFFFEACESWTIHNGEYYCFKCSVDNEKIDWINQFITFRTVELEKRKK